MFMRVLAIVVGAVAFVLTPQLAKAQACQGVPTAEGQVAVTAGAGFTDGAKDFGGAMHGNLRGPLAISGGYSLVTYDGVDEKGHVFGGHVSYEIPNIGMSACPTVGASYGRTTARDPYYDDTLKLSTLTFPLGIGIGGTLVASENVTLTPYATPSLLVQRHSASVTLEGIGSESASESEVEFGMGVGATLGLQQLLLSGGVGFDTADETDSTFSFSVGMMF